MNILLIGNGNMGKEIKKYYKNSNHKIIDTLSKTHKKYIKNERIDVIIDFSSKDALNISLMYALLYKIPLIIGTTNYSFDDIKRIKNASKKIIIVMDSNYSIVFNRFKNIKNYLSNDKIEKNEYIIETHHSNKIDSPSGTAKDLSNNSSIIYSLRGANYYGTHEIRYLYKNEEISIKHIVNSRASFVEGIDFVLNKLNSLRNGLYSLNDLLKE